MQKKLNKLLEKSYSPYSNVKVASIVIDEHNNEFKGVNVENASFGGTICAERSAILNSIANGGNKIKEIHLTSSMEKPLYPCGLCLQFMVETIEKDTKICIWHNGKKDEKTISELLPNQVDKESIGWK